MTEEEKRERARRNAFSNDEAMRDAERLCVPCLLCGGSAKITDAGVGWGYFIICENAAKSRPTCIIGETRKSGWAYNVMELWNLLQTPSENSPALQSAYQRGVKDEREACAKWHDNQVEEYTKQIAVNDAYLARGGRLSSESRANGYCDDQRSTHRRSASAIRSRSMGGE